MVYGAVVSTQGEEPVEYIGSTAGPFKRRWNNHQTSFRHERYKHETTLSSHIWKLKEEGRAFNIEWNIQEKAKAYHPALARCQLCNSEKTRIVLADQDKVLNLRNEIMSKCRHRNRFLLCNVKDNPPD